MLVEINVIKKQLHDNQQRWAISAIRSLQALFKNADSRTIVAVSTDYLKQPVCGVLS